MITMPTVGGHSSASSLTTACGAGSSPLRPSAGGLRGAANQPPPATAGLRRPATPPDRFDPLSPAERQAVCRPPPAACRCGERPGRAWADEHVFAEATLGYPTSALRF